MHLKRLNRYKGFSSISLFKKPKRDSRQPHARTYTIRYEGRFLCPGNVLTV